MSDETTRLAAWLAEFAQQLQSHEAELTELDRLIGDADHGVNMARGATAVQAIDPSEFADPASYLKKVAMTLVSTVGGASGPLYGTLFLRMATACPAAGELDHQAWTQMWQAGVAGLAQRGKAELGDKTMLDALIPAIEAFAAQPEHPWTAALAAADQGRLDTIDMVAKKGRASYLGERSAGVADPGASSACLLFVAGEKVLG